MEKPFDNSLRIIYAKHKTVISDFLTNCFINNKYCDVIFICKNNVCVQSHKAVLISISEYVKKIVHNCVDEIIFISLPDFDSSVVEVFVNFLYEGCTEINLQELCYFKELLTVLDVHLVNCELKPFSSVSREVAIDVENQNTILNGHTEHVETAWCLQGSSDTNFLDSYGLASSFNRTSDTLTESSGTTNETYKASFSCITDGIHCENLSSKLLQNIQSNEVTQKSVEESHINLSSEEVTPASLTRDEESFTPILGISSDVELQRPYSFTSNDDSHSNGALDLMQYFPSYKEDNDSNKKALEEKINVTGFSIEEIYSDTVQEKKDATSVAARKRCSKQKRTFSEKELSILENAYNERKYLDEKSILKLTKVIKVSRIKLMTWFTNRRQKDRYLAATKRNWRLGKKESSMLENVYKERKYLNEESIVKLTKALGISSLKLRRWFINRRSRDSHLKIMPDVMLPNVDDAVTDVVSHKETESNEKNNIHIPETANAVQTHDADYDNDLILLLDNHDSSFINERNVRESLSHQISATCSNKEETPVKGQQHWSSNKNFVKRKYLQEQQRSVLKKVYKDTKYPSKELFTELCKTVKMSEKVLRKWFGKQRELEKRRLARAQKSKHVWNLSVKQYSMIESVYKEKKYLDEKSKVELSKALGISSIDLVAWFRRRRLRDRFKRKTSRRRNLSKEEKSVLENFYRERNCLDEESLAELTKTLGMTRLQLITWFKTRQQKDNHLNSSEQNSSFYNSEESRAVNNLQVFQSISTDEQSLSNEMTTEENVDANDMSMVKTYIDTLVKHESICIEDDKTLGAVSESSDVLLKPNSSFLSYEKLKTVDNSEDYEFHISNNEQCSSNEMTMVEEKDLNFLYPEKMFMDTFEGYKSICTEDEQSLDTVSEAMHDGTLLNIKDAITNTVSHQKKKSNVKKNIQPSVDAAIVEIHNLANNDDDDDDVILLSDDDQDIINERCLVNKESLDHSISTIYSNIKETSVQGTSEAHNDASQEQGSSVSCTEESLDTHNFEISNSCNEDRNSSHIMEIMKQEDVNCFTTNNEIVDANNTEIICFKDKKNLDTVAGMEEFVSLLINAYKDDAGHEGGEKTSYECDTCKKLFAGRNGLVKHIDSAHNNIRYKCSLCQKLFKSCTGMTQHIDSFHNNVGYKCSYCQKVLKTHAGMKRHINTIHIYTSSYNTPS